MSIIPNCWFPGRRTARNQIRQKAVFLRQEAAISRRLIWSAACVYLTGILAAGSDKWLWLLCTSGIWISLILYPLYRRQYLRILLRTAGVFLLAFAAIINIRQQTAFRDNYLERLTEGETVTVYGRIARKEFKNETYRYYLSNVQLLIDPDSCACNSVLLYFDTDEYSVGDTILAAGEAELFDEAVCEGMFDLRTYYQSQKIDFSMTPDACSVTEKAVFPVGERLWQLRQYFGSVLLECASYCPFMEDASTGVLLSMLLGEKSLLDADVRQMYQASGISHILAISGLHLSLIGMGFWRLLRKRRLGFAGCAFGAGMVVLAYGQMTGWAVSAQRAGAMTILSMTASAFGRKTDLLNSLGCAMLVLLWENPFLIEYSGFTFSCMAIVGIAVTGEVFGLGLEQEQKRREPGEEEEKFSERIRSRMKMLAASLAASGAITLTSLPLVAYYYYEIPAYSVFLNLLILPLVSVVFGSGMSGIAAGVLAEQLGRIVPICSGAVGAQIGGIALIPAGLILKFYERLCSICLALPGAQQIVGKPSGIRMLVYYLILGGGLLIMHRSREKRQCPADEKNSSGRPRAEWARNSQDPTKRLSGWFQMKKILLSAGCVGILFFPGIRHLEVDFLDVGQGDGVYIGTKEGASFFIDGGSVTENEVGTYRILPFLKSKGVRSVDYWMISHGDEDHISGFEEVLKSGYRVRYLVLARKMPDDDARQELLELAETAGTQVLWVYPGDTIATDSVCLTCLYPDEAAAELFEDRNDLCLSLLMEEKETGFTALFAGDLSADAEKLLCSSKKAAGVDLLKVCHHGSRYSSSEELLAFLKPKIAVISCGLENSYGHPAAEAVERLEDSGAELFYTMYSGQITVTLENGNICVEPFTGRTASESAR